MSDFFDGDFTIATAVGQPIYSAPFPADPKLYLYKVPYWQLRQNFISLPKDSGGPFGGYHIGESEFKDENGGIISFVREFAFLPDRRSEYESYVYSYQTIHITNGSADSVTETPLTVSSRTQLDYFYVPVIPGGGIQNAITLARAPKVVQVATGIRFLNGWGSLNPLTEILAEDASVSLWKGNIYERRQRFIIWYDIGF